MFTNSGEKRHASTLRPSLHDGRGNPREIFAATIPPCAWATTNWRNRRAPIGTIRNCAKRHD
eukprot:4621806-Lingulodinium_polyedra.AAC.1